MITGRCGQQCIDNRNFRNGDSNFEEFLFFLRFQLRRNCKSSIILVKYVDHTFQELTHKKSLKVCDYLYTLSYA